MEGSEVPVCVSAVWRAHLAARTTEEGTRDLPRRRRQRLRLPATIQVKHLSHTPPLLLATPFHSRSNLVIMSLLSDPELKLTFSVLLLEFIRCYLCFSVLYQLCRWMVSGCFVMFSQCSVTVTMFCNNVL